MVAWKLLGEVFLGIKKTLLAIAVILIIVGSTYFASFFMLTKKYRVVYTDSHCDIARTVSHDWLHHFYYPAAVVELWFWGKSPHKPTLQIYTPEIADYFIKQQSQCSQ